MAFQARGFFHAMHTHSCFPERDGRRNGKTCFMRESPSIRIILTIEQQDEFFIFGEQNFVTKHFISKLGDLKLSYFFSFARDNEIHVALNFETEEEAVMAKLLL
jgi:hypothetical protein